MPVAASLLEHLLADLVRVLGNGLVGAQDQAERLLEHDGAFFQDGRQGGVGGEALGELGAYKTDVVAAVGHLRTLAAVVDGRAQADSHGRAAGQRADTADHHDGPEGAAELLVAGREVLDLHAASGRIVQGRREYGGIAQVGLLGAYEVQKLDVEESRLRFGFTAQQRTERRVAVYPGKTSPDKAPARVDQNADLAVADKPQVKRIHFGPAGLDVC